MERKWRESLTCYVGSYSLDPKIIVDLVLITSSTLKMHLQWKVSRGLCRVWVFGKLFLLINICKKNPGLTDFAMEALFLERGRGSNILLGILESWYWIYKLATCSVGMGDIIHLCRERLFGGESLYKLSFELITQLSVWGIHCLQQIYFEEENTNTQLRWCTYTNLRLSGS